MSLRVHRDEFLTAGKDPSRSSPARGAGRRTPLTKTRPPPHQAGTKQAGSQWLAGRSLLLVRTHAGGESNRSAVPGPRQPEYLSGNLADGWFGSAESVEPWTPPRSR